MKIGMLWFDDDPDRDIQSKVQRAADYYFQKYGSRPTVCFVHPSMVKPGLRRAGRVEIRPSEVVLPHHLWIGVNGNKETR